MGTFIKYIAINQSKNTMEIRNKLINLIPMGQNEPVQKQQGLVSAPNYNSTSLPAVYPAGVSQVNSSPPMAYTKIGEIAVPGLKEKASIFKLANGQKVVIQPKDGPTYIKTTYNVGSLNETENIRGMSHYIEHNLFNGSKDLAPKEYDKRVSELGGSTNASTGFSQTDYYLSLQLLNENSLEKAIRLNALQTQFPTFPVEQLEKEKEPVKSEIDMYKDIPDDVATSLMLKNLFGIQTNSTNFILGTKDNINSFTKDTVLDYFNTWYTPDNAVTVITGDVNTEETIQLVSKYYNKQNDLSKINQRHYEPIKYNDKPIRQDIIQPNATSPSITMGFAIPEGTNNIDLYKLDALVSILCSSDSKLSKVLDKYGIKPSIYMEKMQNKPNGARALILSVSPTEGQIEEVLKIIYEELSYIANNPPTQKEIDCYRKKALNSLNNISELSGNLNYVLTDISMNNEYNYFNDKSRTIQTITPQEISETAKKFLDLNKVSICVSHEKSANSQTITNNYNSVSNNPKTVSFGAAKTPKETINEHINNIKTYKLWNNIETMMIPSTSGTYSSLSLDLNTDELNDVNSPAFMVLNELLDRGSCFRNNDEYKSLLNSKDISLAFHVGSNGLSVTGIFEDENTQDVLPLIKEILTYPNFSQNEFERAKQIIRDSIISEEISPYDKLQQELFPAIKKYAPKEERLKQLEALTLADIQNVYSQLISTAQACATITAPFDKKPYLQNIFNNELSVGLPVFRPFTKQKGDSYKIYTPNTEAKILTAVEDNSQADVCQAYKFKKTKNIDDMAKIELLNIILGGGMSSRLFTDLREDKKLAYSVGSSCLSEKDTDSIILHIGTTTDSPIPNEGSPENLTKALEGFTNNINKLKTENVSQKELEDAKIQYKTSILDTFETSFDKTCAFAASKNSPYDVYYWSNILDAIDKVTVDDIRAAANYVFANPPITSIVASQKTFDTLGIK